MLMIRVELIQELTGTRNQQAKALIVSSDGGLLDGEDANIVTVWDAFGSFRVKGGTPGKRGPEGHAVWMADKQRFELTAVFPPGA